MLAKNITEIKLFIKELDGKNRSNRKTYILVRNCREGSLFCDVHLITITQNKEHLFLSYCQSQVTAYQMKSVINQDITKAVTDGIESLCNIPAKLFLDCLRKRKFNRERGRALHARLKEI
jgi:hypothetical protein